LEGYPSLAGVCADAGYRKTMEKFVKDILRRTIDNLSALSRAGLFWQKDGLLKERLHGLTRPEVFQKIMKLLLNQLKLWSSSLIQHS